MSTSLMFVAAAVGVCLVPCLGVVALLNDHSNRSDDPDISFPSPLFSPWSRYVFPCCIKGAIDPAEARPGLRAKNERLLKEKGIKVAALEADRKLRYGKVIGVQRIGRGAFRRALNAGTDAFPVLRVMNPSSLGGMVPEWEATFPWPACDLKARGRENLESNVAILEVPESAAKKARDAEKSALGVTPFLGAVEMASNQCL